MAKMSEIAGWIGVKAPALEAEITEVSNMEGATGNSLVFATDSTTLTAALESKAGAILASDKLELWELPADPRIVWASDVRYAFALVAKRLKGKGFEAGSSSYGGGWGWGDDWGGDERWSLGGAGGWGGYR